MKLLRLIASLAALIIALCLLPSCNTEPAPTPSPPSEPQDSNFSYPPWDDFSIFKDTLIEEERQILDNPPAFTIYHIDLRISSDISKVEASEEVLYTNNENAPLEKICFRLFPNLYGGNMTVSSVKINGKEAQAVYEDEKTTLAITLETPLNPQDSVTVSMVFSFDIPRNVLVSYGIFGYSDGVLSLDSFYPVIPVFDENGWDTQIPPYNGDKTYLDPSFYIIQVEAPADFTVVATGSEVNSAVNDGRKNTAFAAGPSRDFFISASDAFKKTSQSVGETAINSYYLEGNSQTSDFALETAANTLRILNELIGPYSYTELDIAPLPLQAGALGIEYPGVAGIGIDIYKQNTTFEASIAHEVAHQWFYNAIGNDQVSEPWLDEAFAQYATGLYFADIYGPNGWAGVFNSWLDRWSRVAFADTPIGMEVGDYEGREYGAIIYGRAPIFVHELALTLGEEVFNEFLKGYYLEYKWGIIDAELFQALAESYCLCDLSGLFNEWVYVN